MKKNVILPPLIIVLAVCLLTMSAAVGDDDPVRISFDSSSKRVDLVTGRELPDYTLAKRGSVQLFRGRLDEPETAVTFFHDGVRTANISGLALMEKVQKQFSIWRLRYKSGSKNTPRIHNQAVSFIPLDKETNEPGRRVYVLLNDLTLIDWRSGNERENAR